MKPATTNLVLAVALASASLLPACGSTPPATFYLMDEVPPGQVPTAERELVIAVGPLTVAEYLDRAQILTRASDNRVELNEYHRWAEPLKVALPRVMAVNLTRRLSTRKVSIYPAQGRDALDYQVKVDIEGFEGGPDGMVSLQARWTLIDGRTLETILVQLSAIEEPVEGESVGALVSAMNAAFAELCEEIATAVLR